MSSTKLRTTEIIMKKQLNPPAPDQPHLEPKTNEASRLNTPNDVDAQVEWQRRKGNVHKESIQRAGDAKRLKGGKTRD
jgi:hypothetical protein